MSINPEESVFQMSQNIVDSEVEDKKTKLDVQIGHATDIGGSTHKPNQDRKFVIPFVEHDGCLIGVADGHGIRGEQVASLCERMINDLVQEKMDKLVENPVAFLEGSFDSIQEEVIRNFNGSKCGTTFSLILMLGKKMWIANVGDSTGILCSKHPIFKSSDLSLEKDAAVPDKVTIGVDENIEPSKYIVLTSEGHSPENPEEYVRMRNFKCSEEDPSHAELLCVYDKPGKRKETCPPVFNISEDGTPTVRPLDGSFEYYFKNVRSEKATYVSDRYGENVLASTRSLGDYNLNILGITHKPEIRSMDLVPVFEKLKAQIASKKESPAAGGGEAVVESEPDPVTICVLLASDGVWDNMIFESAQKIIMYKNCLLALEKNKLNGAQQICNTFMLENQKLAKKYFGNNSDNASCVVMYITEK
jgi:serine/threonine protein phosphatase PrpC